ncbi:prolipoprotein diacylglyceryl transferase [Patescibacteria group bacterium]|nr:prolipoprotein diacylglyceryl transferase [Patescibacteria group bacterium]
MFNFLHTFHPNSIFLKIGPLEIHWYSLLMIAGGALGLFIAVRLARFYKYEKNFFYDLVLYWVIGAILGARIYYVIYAWELYRENWIDIFKIWQGGLAVHGIMIGGFIATIIYCKKKRVDFWLTADLSATGLVSAQAIGRIGNYFNQEIFGRPTESSWGIPIDIVNRPFEFMQFEYFHPVFLYEVLGNILIASILLLVHRRRRKTGNWISGNIFFIYLILYSIQRFFLEFVRIDYSPHLCGLRWAQIFSILIAAVVAVVFVYRRKRAGR